MRVGILGVLGANSRARLPAGPFERLYLVGVQGGICEMRSVLDLQKGVDTFLGRTLFRGSLC